MSYSSKTIRPRGLRAALVLFLLPAALRASAIAVLRGQAMVDPSILPLVCIEIATLGTPLPVDRLIVENLETHTEETFILTNSFNRSHPDLLTAAAPGPASLSLPILKFRPGHYRLKSIVFVGPGDGFALDLLSAHVGFEVRAGVVNYVGSVEIGGDWRSLYNQAYRAPAVHNEARRASVLMQTLVRASQPRDIRWACDQIPGMKALPSVISPMAQTN